MQGEDEFPQRDALREFSRFILNLRKALCATAMTTPSRLSTTFGDCVSLAILLGSLFCGCNPSACVAAKPYIPQRDDEVLEKLPHSVLAGSDEMAILRRRLASEPTDSELASMVASRYVQMGSQSGDPRYFGYARAALSTWWEVSDAPPSILKLRAKLKEKDHRYDEALADLRLLLERKPSDVQAWVEKANICRVQGKYRESLAACEQLADIAGPTRSLLCRIPIQAVRGEAEQAYDSLAQMLPETKRRWPAAVQWVTTMQAKVAVALDLEAAEQHFRAGLQSDPADYYLIREYADYLLDRDRNGEALYMLREHLNDNGILLRAAIAARRVGEKQLFEEWTARLQRRFEEIRLRGSQPHGRFEARYLLELKDDPDRALSVALANWEKQKEGRDTRNVLEAAVAAGNREAATPVVEFLTKHGTEDVVLQRLVDQLGNTR